MYIESSLVLLLQSRHVRRLQNRIRIDRTQAQLGIRRGTRLELFLSLQLAQLDLGRWLQLRLEPTLQIHPTRIRTFARHGRHAILVHIIPLLRSDTADLICIFIDTRRPSGKFLCSRSIGPSEKAAKATRCRLSCRHVCCGGIDSCRSSRSDAPCPAADKAGQGCTCHSGLRLFVRRVRGRPDAGRGRHATPRCRWLGCLTR